MKKLILLLFGLSLLVTAVIYFSQDEPADDDPIVTVPPVERLYTKSDPEFLYELGPGVNLAGAEFASGDSTYQHRYPTESLDYYASKGIKLVRLPFLWERVQPTLDGELDVEEVNDLKEFLNKAESLNIYVILDLHNYLQYKGEYVGRSLVTKEILARFWINLISDLGMHNAIVAYGIMNEPNEAADIWPEIAQYTLTEIRKVDTETLVLIAGDNWSSASNWLEFNENLRVDDPYNRVLYETHAYFDPGSRGSYECSFDECNVSIAIGDMVIADFIDWLERNDLYGFVGEYGVPADDDRWTRVVDQFLSTLKEHQIGSVMWAGGPDWGDYILSIEPKQDGEKLIEKPQVDVLEKYQFVSKKIETIEK